MNIEEAIEILNELKEIFSSPDPFKDDKDYDRAEAIEALLTAYEKEKETSHYIQSQLDIANAKLIEEKEKNKKIEIIVNKLMPLAECSYWNYENHTCTHTCRGCDYLNEDNKRTSSGILIDKDRYCRLYEDGNAEKDTKFVDVEDLIKRHLKEE